MLYGQRRRSYNFQIRVENMHQPCILPFLMGKKKLQPRNQQKWATHKGCKNSSDEKSAVFCPPNSTGIISFGAIELPKISWALFVNYFFVLYPSTTVTTNPENICFICHRRWKSSSEKDEWDSTIRSRKKKVVRFPETNSHTFRCGLINFPRPQEQIDDDLFHKSIPQSTSNNEILRPPCRILLKW